MSDNAIIGIDLGTTFSAVAYINNYGKAEVIPNREGDRTTPSVVFFEDDNTPVVGEAARNQAIINPLRTVRAIKREMGNPSYRLNISGKEYFPEDLSAMILKKLKADAESFTGQQIEKAVISVPAYFKDAQREATRQAGEIAGLDVVRIVNEPTAAALAYGAEKVTGAQTIVVYDFGGGTFDVTVMRIEGNSFTVLATDGDAKLGGKDIDGRLVDYLAEEFQSEHGVDLRTEPHSHQDLWDKAEIAKKDLSFRNNVAITLALGEKTLRADLERDKYEELIEDLVDQTQSCMNRAVNGAGVTWEDVDSVLLAGGSSRIPAVRSMIANVTGKEALKDLNPDECVAIGAAIQGQVFVAESLSDGTKKAPQESTDLVVKDVAAHSLGVKALDQNKNKKINSIIIPKLTEVPCEKKRTYTTNKDNQKSVEIEVLQGESEDPNSPDVEFVGRVKLDSLPPHKAGELVIDVLLKYDIDGVIEVTAKEVNSGVMVKEVLMQKNGLLSQDIVEAKTSELEDLAL
ncbi:MAG: Hsp70 family protein [Candidatus Thiodiazotropha sp. (ex Ctena orbiculata)]|nr:Hsp70 family protein [Candidatus Thiodiazotropha taylori]